MGWSLRKSFRILPGVRINLLKSGPRLSVGVPGARASIDMEGKTKLYGGMGPVRYQKTVNIGSRGEQPANGGGLLALVKRIFGGW
jgi:hypothetical protein